MFVDVSERVKLDFVHEMGPRLTYFMPEIMGAGSALFDFDGDGDLDVYLINGATSFGVEIPAEPPRNRLFRQEADGTFVEVTDGSGLDDTGYGMGVATGDFDNDGRVDIYVTNYGANELFRNRGDGTFENVTDAAGVGDNGWGTSATFLDYDHDGWRDLFVANYLLVDTELEGRAETGRRDYCDVGKFAGDIDRLYHNEGDGTFTNVTESSGIGKADRKGLGVVGADLTGDGLIDIYVANDMQPNQLWVNRGDGTFVDEAVMRGVAYNDAGAMESSMGIVCADLDGDLGLDLFLTHLGGHTHTLYRNDGEGSFHDATAATGIAGPSLRFTGFGTGGVDVEHDGDLDLIVANGHVLRAPPEPGASLDPFWNDYAQPGTVLRNEGGRFVDVSDEAGRFGSDPQVGRGLAFGDVDEDGDVDFLASNCGGRALLFYNEAEKSGHWLIVRAWDPALARDVLGAQVTVVASGRRHVQLVNTGYSYLTGSDPRVHFGLGDAGRVDSIEIVWPGGELERFPGGAVDRRVTLNRGEGSR